MSAEKTELARAGTMQVTAKSLNIEGKAYLDKNLTEWKKPYLLEEGEEEEEHDSSPVKKAKLSKHSTMKGTAKEAAGYLAAHGKPDNDALTRGQQKKIEQLQSEKSPKKGRMARDNTMACTAKEGRALVGDKLGDTRAETKKSKKGKVGRSSTMSQVAEEAKLLYGDMPATEGRSLRKRSAPPPPKVPAKKKAPSKGTGKRGRPKKNVEKEEKKEEENNKDSEEDEEEKEEEEEDEN